MNYIIDPSVFYWMKVLNSISSAFSIIGIIALIGSGAALFLYLACRNDDDDEEDLAPLRKMTIFLFIVGLVLFLISVFVPDKSTSIEMLIAKTATPDNVDWTVQQLKDVVDYIVAAVKSI